MDALTAFIRAPIVGLMLFNLAGFLLAIAIMATPWLKSRFFATPILLQKSLVLWIALPVLLLPILPQPRLDFIPIYIAWPIGGLISAAALVVWVLAMARIGVIPSVRAAKGLVDTGIYGVVRNPIYLGNILSALGPALLMRAAYALLYAPLVLLLYLLIVFVEEKDLLRQYGEEYEDYRQQVHYRLIPFIL